MSVGGRQCLPCSIVNITCHKCHKRQAVSLKCHLWHWSLLVWLGYCYDLRCTYKVGMGKGTMQTNPFQTNYSRSFYLPSLPCRNVSLRTIQFFVYITCPGLLVLSIKRTHHPATHLGSTWDNVDQHCKFLDACFRKSGNRSCYTVGAICI